MFSLSWFVTTLSLSRFLFCSKDRIFEFTYTKILFFCQDFRVSLPILFFLCFFGPSPVHDHPCFLHPVTPLSCRCPPIFRIEQFSGILSHCVIHLFLGFPTGLIPPRLPSIICFGIRLSFLLHSQPTVTVHQAFTLPDQCLCTKLVRRPLRML